MAADLVTYGTGGAVALLIIREVFKFVDARKTTNGSGKSSGGMIKDLWDWHSKEDEDGVKVWYMQKSFKETMMKMAEQFEQQNRTTIQLLITMKENTKALQDLTSDLRKRPCVNRRDSSRI